MPTQFRIPHSKPNLGKEEFDAVLDVLKSDWPSQGKVTEEFETLLSQYLSSNAIVLNNGSSALMAALIAHGIKPGNKVIVPAFTFVATSSIPKLLGAEVILADIDKNTLNVNPATVEEIVKVNNVKAVIVVDVSGLPVDVDAFEDISKRYNFTLIEDAAQSFGAEYKNKKLGAFEHTTIFSFQIAKQLTTIEGGCIATLNDKVIKRISQIKDYGRNKNDRYVSDVVGANFRTTDLQSAIGLIQFKKLEEHIVRRNQIAEEYKKKIKGLDFQAIPKYVTRHSYMLFFALAQDKKMRDNYVKEINNHGVEARKPWTPIHMQPCNPELRPYRYPNAEEVFDRSFTIPLYNSMTLNEARIVIDSCNM